MANEKDYSITTEQEELAAALKAAEAAAELEYEAARKALNLARDRRRIAKCRAAHAPERMKPYGVVNSIECEECPHNCSFSYWPDGDDPRNPGASS